MPPAVLAVERIEMIRDGGSLWAMYAASDGFSYTLGLPIKMQDRERTGYRLPFRGRRIPVERDGVRVGNRHEGVTELSWSEAKALLESMRNLVDQRDAFQCEHFEQMLYVAEHDGSLPPGITRDFT